MSDFGSSLLDALTNPGVSALAGMAEGFARAAMPTRMPVPWGATLGMGAAGALQGMQAGQQLQQAAQQVARGGMQNQLLKAQMPMELAKTKMLTDVWQHPELMQTMMGGGGPAPASAPQAPPAAAPVAPVDQAGATKAALASLPDDVRPLAVKAAMGANLPPGAWAPWIATVKNESGWNLQAPDHENPNGSFDVGPGQVNSRTAGDLGYTVDQLRDPATNLMASAKYFGQQWRGNNGNPALAIGHYNAGPNGTPDGAYVGRGMTTLGSWGYQGAPAADGSASPDSAMATANWYETQANDLQQKQAVAKFWQSQGMPVMPPAGDPAALRQAAQQWRTYALAGPTALAQKQAELQTAGPIAAEKARGAAPYQFKLDRFSNVWGWSPEQGWHWLGRSSEVKPVWQPPHVENGVQVPGRFVYGDVGAMGIGVPPAGTPEPPAQETPDMARMNIAARNAVLEKNGVMPPVGGGPVVAPPTATPAPAAATAPSGGASAPPGLSPQDAAVLRQNPEAARGFIARFGNAAYQAAIGQPAAPAGTATPPAATPPPAVQQDTQHLAPGITAHALPGGGTAITDTRHQQAAQYDDDMKDLREATEQAVGVQSDMQRFYEMRNLVDRLPQMGSGGGFRAGIANVVQTYIKPIPGIGGSADAFLHKLGDLPDASVAQEFAKLTVQAAGMQEKSAVGARGSLGLTELFMHANPNIDLQPDAAKMMANFLLVQHQMELDYLRGLHDHVTNAGQSYLQGKSDYVPAATFDRQWIGQDNEKTYVAATEALSGRPFADWSKLLGTPEQLQAAINEPQKYPQLASELKATLGVVQRVDPNAHVLWADGQPHAFGQVADAQQ